jgi:hypothetical protein
MKAWKLVRRGALAKRISAGAAAVSIWIVNREALLLDSVLKIN